MLAFQERLAEEYSYKPIQPNLFLGDVREKYRQALPEWCRMDGNPDCVLRSVNQGIAFATGYSRIVIGDYGAFLEIPPEMMIMQNVVVKPGEEYRILEERFSSRVKYHWYTVWRDHEVKLYFQVGPVTYADYVPGQWYVSPYHVLLKGE